MEAIREDPIIDPDKDYCSVCGVELELMENWMVDIPLCRECWIEDKQREIDD